MSVMWSRLKRPYGHITNVRIVQYCECTVFCIRNVRYGSVEKERANFGSLSDRESNSCSCLEPEQRRIQEVGHRILMWGPWESMAGQGASVLLMSGGLESATILWHWKRSARLFPLWDSGSASFRSFLRSVVGIRIGVGRELRIAY